MMTIEEFTTKLAAEFEDTDTSALTPDTNFREMPDWSSMHALIIVAFVDSEFDVLLKGEDLHGTNTIRDLYNLVKSKI